jgi:hypothetical protein
MKHYSPVQHDAYSPVQRYALLAIKLAYGQLFASSCRGLCILVEQLYVLLAF